MTGRKKEKQRGKNTQGKQTGTDIDGWKTNSRRRTYEKEFPCGDASVLSLGCPPELKELADSMGCGVLVTHTHTHRLWCVDWGSIPNKFPVWGLLQLAGMLKDPRMLLYNHWSLGTLQFFQDLCSKTEVDDSLQQPMWPEGPWHVFPSIEGCYFARGYVAYSDRFLVDPHRTYKCDGQDVPIQHRARANKLNTVLMQLRMCVDNLGQPEHVVQAARDNAVGPNIDFSHLRAGYPGNTLNGNPWDAVAEHNNENQARTYILEGWVNRKGLQEWAGIENGRFTWDPRLQTQKGMAALAEKQVMGRDGKGIVVREMSDDEVASIPPYFRYPHIPWRAGDPPLLSDSSDEDTSGNVPEAGTSGDVPQAHDSTTCSGQKWYTWSDPTPFDGFMHGSGDEPCRLWDPKSHGDIPDRLIGDWTMDWGKRPVTVRTFRLSSTLVAQACRCLLCSRSSLQKVPFMGTGKVRWSHPLR
ncbi:hypothetical protein DUNSADRAFT_7123 [Dunaliella salina]|uniref:Uncharacterized protein n=1 Tax=Dunaliella salina TaxID=3046 RepID=A0ABQ7GLY9_DUNSA|nr:hypothetical protein DUNSADRAFT_7123 [Dunaliella salina]|eukprot:KAF5835622.1 hypothetical protein DUNSADRAFT_7123 [Dunaliella salina]